MSQVTGINERAEEAEAKIESERRTKDNLLIALKNLVSAISGMYIEFVDREEIIREAEKQAREAIAEAEGR
jgi:hypothetical protein